MINSTGSSTVIIFDVLVLFISLTIAASVVDLPEPVGPVTKTRPLCISLYHKVQEEDQIVPLKV